MRKKSHTLRNIILAIIGVPVIAIAVLLMTFDANKYKPQISEFLSAQIGRTVKIDGPIKLGLSWSQGFYLGVKDISIDNPPWASRPVMAKVGSISLGVALPPLLQNRGEVKSFTLADADILLETSQGGVNNWDLKPMTEKKPEHAAAPESGKGQAAKPMRFSIDAVKVTNTKIGKRGPDGKTAAYLVKDLAFNWRGKGAELKVDAEVNGASVGLDLKSSSGVALDKIMESEWPFEADVRYDKLNVKMSGVLNGPKKTVAMNGYTLMAGDSKITGQMVVAYGGARPAVKGTVNGDKVDPADFKMESKGAAKEETAKPAAATAGGEGKKRLFSDEPLNFDGLKAADAYLDIKIAQLAMGPSSLKDLQTKLDLTNGRLLLSPFKAMVADKAVEGQIKLDAESRPAQVATLLKAYQIDLSELVKLGGLSSFIESKGDADMDLTTAGNSLHEMASNANGQINLVMAGGKVSERVASDIAGDLLNILAPGAGGLTKPGLNCFVAHLKIANGVLRTDGLLMDTAQATIAGSGGANLRDETMDMVLRARTKAPDTSALTKVDINQLAPPLRISGPLTSLSYKPDASGTVSKVVGIFAGGAANGDTGVPEIVQQEGQNACEYTLKHPQPGKPAAAVPATVNEVVDKAKEKAKDVGNKLMEGVGGLFGR